MNRLGILIEIAYLKPDNVLKNPQFPRSQISTLTHD